MQKKITIYNPHDKRVRNPCHEIRSTQEKSDSQSLLHKNPQRESTKLGCDGCLETCCVAMAMTERRVKWSEDQLLRPLAADQGMVAGRERELKSSWKREKNALLGAVFVTSNLCGALDFHSNATQNCYLSSENTSLNLNTRLKSPKVRTII